MCPPSKTSQASAPASAGTADTQSRLRHVIKTSSRTNSHTIPSQSADKVTTKSATNSKIGWKGNNNENEEKKLSDHRRPFFSSGPSRAIAPIAIIGGTASVYASALRHSASIQNHQNAVDAFTPVSMVYLLLLALNYAVMPRLSKRYIHPATNKQSVALVEEIVKTSLGVGGWVLSSMATANSRSSQHSESFITTMSVMSEELQQWSPFSTLIAAGLPSALYALQGTLTYTAYQNLDAVTFNGLTQFKVLSSALCCYIVLGKKQSMIQVLALGSLILSTIIFQGSWKDLFLKLKWADSNSGSGEGSGATEKEGSKNFGGSSYSITSKRHLRLVYGVAPCLGATFLSGLAGAFSQRSLQTQVGSMHRNAYFYTIEISLLSALCLAFSMAMDCWRSRHTGMLTKTSKCSEGKNKESHFFDHWTFATLLPITTKATAGLLTALVHRHLGSVIKGFALVLGLVFSALLQFALEGTDLSGGQILGTALVLLSSWLHFTHPHR